MNLEVFQHTTFSKNYSFYGDAYEFFFFFMLVEFSKPASLSGLSVSLSLFLCLCLVGPCGQNGSTLCKLVVLQVKTDFDIWVLNFYSGLKPFFVSEVRSVKIFVEATYVFSSTVESVSWSLLCRHSRGSRCRLFRTFETIRTRRILNEVGPISETGRNRVFIGESTTKGLQQDSIRL